MSNNREVLIVDDDPAIAEALFLMLEDAGYAVRVLHEDETMETVQKHIPGVLLLDIWLAGRDGRTICRYLKSQPATHNLPIILISANNDIQRISREVGADDYLAKPFGMQEVVMKVRKYLAP